NLAEALTVPRRFGVHDVAAPARGERRHRTAADVRHSAGAHGAGPGGARLTAGRAASRRFDGRLRARDRAAAARRAGGVLAPRRRGLQAPRDRCHARRGDRDVEAAAPSRAHADAEAPEWMMTMHEEWTDKLSEYLDDELSPREREAVESHLRGCAECAAVLDDLARVVERAQRLDRRPPRADLWDGIAARIETRGAAPRRVSFTLPQLAAAAVVLIAASAGIAWQFADRAASRSDIARSTEAQSRASSGYEALAEREPSAE